MKKTHRVNALLWGLFGSPVKSPSARQVGDGQKRAAARLAAKHIANKDTPSGERYTRQQDRARMRALKKELRASRKAFMKENDFPGGPAEVRS